MQTTTQIARLRNTAQPILLRTSRIARMCARKMAEAVRQHAVDHGEPSMRAWAALLAQSPMFYWPDIPLAIAARAAQKAASAPEADVRAALAFWASETDAQVCLDIVSGS
jgi:hypothetical protein